MKPLYYRLGGAALLGAALGGGIFYAVPGLRDRQAPYQGEVLAQTATYLVQSGYPQLYDGRIVFWESHTASYLYMAEFSALVRGATIDVVQCMMVSEGPSRVLGSPILFPVVDRHAGEMEKARDACRAHRAFRSF